MEDRFACWREQLPAAWREFLPDSVEPAFENIPADIEIGDRQTVFPGEPVGVFSVVPPCRVRAVLLGEDPYPDPSQATGRAFDPGGLDRWQSATPGSPQRLAQQLADYRRPGFGYAARQGGWSRVRAALTACSDALELPAPTATFHSWERQGVLLLNAALTASEGHIRNGDPGRNQRRAAHRSFWAPVVRAVCRRLAERDQPTVLLCWGRSARKLVQDAGVLSSSVCPFPVTPSCNRTAVLVRDHPRISSFLDSPNVFREANAALSRLDAQGSTIQWVGDR